MGLNKKVKNWSIVITVLCIITSIVLFAINTDNSNIIDYIINWLIGISASGILVVATAVIAYNYENSRTVCDCLKSGIQLLHCCNNIADCIIEQKNNNFSDNIQSMKMYYDQTFSLLIILSSKKKKSENIKIIEAAVSEASEFLLLMNEMKKNKESGMYTPQPFINAFKNYNMEINNLIKWLNEAKDEIEKLSNDNLCKYDDIIKSRKMVKNNAKCSNTKTK